MAYIPPDAQWYIADLVEEIRVEDDPRTVIHVNTVLVRADSPDEAHERATALGQQHSLPSHENPDGKRVTTRFRGLAQLNVIHEPLEHGAELTFREVVTSTASSAIRGLVRRRDRLAVFSKTARTRNRPDYSSREIMDAARALVRKGPAD